MLSIYLLTWLGVMAAQISPGPNLAAVASVGLAQGRRPALCVVVGISSGMLVWSAATALGLGALIEAYPLSLPLMKFLGGGYLLLLGVGAFWSYSPIPKLHLCGPRSHLSFLVKD
jgi:threonine/homoserine/homoserine lactone efflux protein